MTNWIKTADGYTWRGYEIRKAKAWNQTIWLISRNGEVFSKKHTLREAKEFMEIWLDED